MSGMEIERKFLIKDHSFKQLSHSHSHILQGYICSDRGRTIRVRLRDDKAFLTIKGPSADGGLSRYEFEHPISRDEAEHLLLLCEPGIIDKTRYLVEYGQHTFEVDEFHGDNDGLVMAEVELSAPDEHYERPDFLGKEVTGDRRYYNSHLRRYPYCQWKDDI
ncbi:MAG: CYTH domain-containing protein [Prevotella sp.]|nr:CYTH domain-containing protein [Prevotella sp.]